MTLLSPIFPIVILLIALSVGALLNRKFKLYNSSGRFECIDGLRGFLALLVFVHHSVIWHGYIRTGFWGSTGSNTFDHFGGTSVAFFFMITAFLFTNKFLVSGKNINWKKFYIGRLLRLGPMYYFTVFCILIIVAVETKFELQVPLETLTESIARWCSFSFFGMPAINGYSDTAKINSSVFWSLSWEWFFYFSLPFIWMAIHRKSLSIIVLTLCGLACLYFLANFGLSLLPFFAAGCIPALLLKLDLKNINWEHWGFSILIIACLCIIPFTYPKGKSSLLPITTIFTLVAMGNSVFGILKMRALQFLGEISYSTYVLHGILLYICFKYILGLHNLLIMTESQYCFIIFGITVFLVLLSFLTFKFIEKPGMDYAKKLR